MAVHLRVGLRKTTDIVRARAAGITLAGWRSLGSVSEWPKEAVCKIAGAAYVGSNPTRPTSLNGPPVLAGRCARSQNQLHLDDVEPASEFAANLALDSDEFESAGGVERDRCLVPTHD